MKSSQAGSYERAPDDERSWRSFSTGDPKRRSYHSIKRDANGYPIFVRASLGARADLPVNEGDVRNKDANEGETGQAPEESHARVVNGEEDNHESMAKLYARLISVKRPRPESDGRSTSVRDIVPAEPRRPIRIKTTRPSKNDWFIQRAVARQQIDRRESSTTETDRPQQSHPAELLSEQLRCSTCRADVRSKADLKAHQSSIAHLVASDAIAEAKEEETTSAEPNRPDRANDVASTSRSKKAFVVLKSSNVGYKALEKMGWRSGMGLGRSEWASVHAAQTTASPVEESGASVIATSSTSSGASENQRPPSMPQSPSVDHSIAGISVESRPARDAGDDDARAEAAVRPLLEPIPVHVRPDRRGVGSALPSSARVRDRPAASRSIEGAKSDKQASEPTEQYTASSQGARRKDIKAKAEQDRAQRMAIRASLDW